MTKVEITQHEMHRFDKTLIKFLLEMCLRGGTPPWGVIFHENVNFLFVAKKCRVTHTFHKIHNQYVIAAIETHILVNYLNKTVFGDLCFSAKN